MNLVSKHVNRLKKSISNRFSSDGKTAAFLRNAKIIEELINEIPEKNNEVKYWKKSYLQYFYAYHNHFKKGLYVPKFIARNFYPRKYWGEFVEKHPNSMKEKFINLNGIFLPKSDNCDYSEESFGNVILDTLLQHLLQFDVEDIKKIDYKLYSIFPEGPYEYGNVYLEEGDIVIDAGSCMGDFAALAVYKKCIPYAFEPSQGTIDKYLNKTAEMNPGIIVAPYALSHKKEVLEYVFKQDAMGSSFLSSTDGDLKRFEKYDNLIRETVNAIDLDSFVHENNLEKVDFIKADIEGAERDMLKGAQNTLKEFAPKLALCTYHLEDDPEVMEELILQANPNYIVEQQFAKLYAYVPK